MIPAIYSFLIIIYHAMVCNDSSSKYCCHVSSQCGYERPSPIEIINNTRGGIVILVQSKKGNAAIGGQKIKMLK